VTPRRRDERAVTSPTLDVSAHFPQSFQQAGPGQIEQNSFDSDLGVRGDKGGDDGKRG
jgi:hypothetical protein